MNGFLWLALYGTVCLRPQERGGSSRQAIIKYIMANFKVGTDEKAVGVHVRMSLKKGVAKGSLKQVKGSGASGSFRMGEEAKKEKKPKKKASTPKKKKASTPKKKAVAKKPAAGAAKKPKKPKAKTAAKKTKSPAKKAAAKPKKSPAAAKKPAAKKAAKSPKKKAAAKGKKPAKK